MHQTHECTAANQKLKKETRKRQMDKRKKEQYTAFFFPYDVQKRQMDFSTQQSNY